MNVDQVCALLGGIGLAVAVRVSNMLMEWLARVLHVRPPEPIPESIAPTISARNDTSTRQDRPG